MKVIEATGKKLDDAINEGLSQLGVKIDDVDVEILCSGSWLRKAKVRITFDEEAYELNKQLQNEISGKKSVAEEQNTDREEKKPDRFGKRRENRPRRERFPEKSVVKEPAPENNESGDAPAVKEETPAEPIKPVSEQQVEIARNYLTELLSLMGIEASLVFNTDKGSLDIDIVTKDTAIIGHHGEVLDAVQQLCKRAVEEGEDKRLVVNVDCKGYRENREKTLVAMANRMAAKAIKTGRKVVLEPMNNTQRKIIHAALNDNDKVFTKSEGKEPGRRVIIIPKRSGNGRRYDRYGKRPEKDARSPENTAPSTPIEPVGGDNQ